MHTPAAFDPLTRTWAPSATPGALPVPELRGELVSDEASLREAAEDFGHLVHHRPRAVLRPGAVSDVTTIVTFANRAGLRVTARGAGHSTYGQAQIAGGIVIDMTRLDDIGEVRDRRITAQGGALWSAVLDAALATGHTPPVLTDYLHTTVGGTLAVGGVGGTSHRHGLQVDAVLELEVVTGAGQWVRCSRQRDRLLFDAVRAGLGQCGIITGATLRLVPAPTHVRYYRLYYSEPATFLADQRRLVTGGEVDHLQGQIIPPNRPGSPGEDWCYLLEVGVYHTPPTSPDHVLIGLRHAVEEIQDLGYREFAHRMAPGEAALRASGEWGYPHPWLTVLLPEQTTASVVHATLADPATADLGGSGVGLLYPLRTDRFQAPLTRVPDAELVWLFALLRSADADDPAAPAAMVEANRVVYDRVRAHGGVGYPINSLRMSPADWHAHFGPRSEQLLSAAEFDPGGVLAFCVPDWR